MASVVSQVAVETLIRIEPKVRTSQVAVEVLYLIPVPAFVSQVSLEVLKRWRWDEVTSFEFIRFDE